MHIKKGTRRLKKKGKRMSKMMKGGWVNNIHENSKMSLKDKLKYYFETGHEKYPFFKLKSGEGDIYNIKD